MNKDTFSATLSILIPVYNSENTIDRLVEGLVNNLGSLYKLEIILVNDNSTDSSEEVCITLFEKYTEIVKFYSIDYYKIESLVKANMK